MPASLETSLYEQFCTHSNFCPPAKLHLLPGSTRLYRSVTCWKAVSPISSLTRHARRLGAGALTSYISSLQMRPLNRHPQAYFLKNSLTWPSLYCFKDGTKSSLAQIMLTSGFLYKEFCVRFSLLVTGPEYLASWLPTSFPCAAANIVSQQYMFALQPSARVKYPNDGDAENIMHFASLSWYYERPSRTTFCKMTQSSIQVLHEWAEDDH